MRKVNVEVHEDGGRPGGGHAVIRLIGLEKLPDRLTYRIKPVDGAQHGEGANVWLDGERVPLATRLTPDGAELVVGPEIVENPVFLPGTLAVIEVPKCGVRGEFLWPRIAPLARPKRKHLIGAKPARESAEGGASEVAFGEAHDASSSLTPLTAAAAPAAEAIVVSVPAAASDRAAVGDGTDGAATTVVPASISLDELLAGVTTALPEAAEPPASPVAAEQPLAASPVSTPPPAAGSAAAPIAAEPPAQQGSFARAPHEMPAAPIAQSKRNPIAIGVAAGLAAAAIGLGAGALMRGGGGAVPVREAVARAAEPAVLLPLLAPAAIAVQGPDGRDIPPQKLLEEADARLHGSGGTRNRREAAQLLRRYLVATVAEERTLWALTQLGSVYAEPDVGEAPDYGKARQLWELASGLGDGVAMCFVATLHEHGLGVAVDRAAALRWYQRAGQAGGCPDVAASIERLSGKK